jgi:hypothetical protein
MRLKTSGGGAGDKNMDCGGPGYDPHLLLQIGTKFSDDRAAFSSRTDDILKASAVQLRELETRIQRVRVYQTCTDRVCVRVC